MLIMDYLFMSLDAYWGKRNFMRTSEPEGKVGKEGKRKDGIYVIQKHQATHLHYDFRLEKDGVLKSWAIPKEPPVEKGVKRLAVMVEDHPLEYADFEGTIPEGEYGAGLVQIWDKGTFEIEKWDENGITVLINGSRLNGRYCLVRFRKEQNSWLFFKC
ncbi:MAG: DNA polymerase ligase N-terminal domain-containing protein [Candidatus Bathyarchaeia archaeon]